MEKGRWFRRRLEVHLEVVDAKVISLVHRTLAVLVYFILLWPGRRKPPRHIGSMMRCVIIVFVDCSEVALRIDGQVQDVKADFEVSKLLGVLKLCGVKSFHAVRSDIFAGKSCLYGPLTDYYSVKSNLEPVCSSL